jgi:hypothetical protein
MIEDDVMTKYILVCVLEGMWQEAFTKTLMYYMDLNRWFWMMSWPNLSCSVIGTDEKMLSWPNLKCYMDWKVCERMLSRHICSNMWIRIDDRG